MRLAWLYIIAGILVWPVGSQVAAVGDKPIDLILSDLMFLLMPLTYLLARTKTTKAQVQQCKVPIRAYMTTPTLALIFIVYSTALAGIGMGLSGELIRIYSAFKLAKPIGFVFLGMLMGSWSDPFEFVAITGRAYGILVAITMFFTVTEPDFPLGDWGRYIFELELGGYPNSPMSFYAVLVPLLLACADCSKLQFSKLIYWGLAACSTLIILGSMSRSSILAVLCGVVIYMTTTGRAAILGMWVAGFAVLSVIGFGLFSVLRETEVGSVLTQRIQIRLERTTEGDDPSSGRFEIWQLALELWAEQPLFGYMFESFSRYAEVDTPHQQYLEVLHKCGGLGLLVYTSLLVSCLAIAARLRRLTASPSPARYYLCALTAMLIGVMTGNLTQPNLTYSLTGNFVFFMFGCICSSRAVVSASQRASLPRPASTNWKPISRRRAAA